MDMTEIVKQKALELGFDLVGVTSAAALENCQQQAFSRWLKSDYAGQMEYMRRNLNKRIDPKLLFDGARSVVVVGLNYKLPEQDNAMSLPEEPFGTVARYARYEDYHIFIRYLLGQLAEFLSEQTGGNACFKVCVDSAPLAERAFAMRAGLGFIGRNHMLINPELGPEILLGELITDLELGADEPLDSNCAGCDRCIKACPTGAMRPDGQFDASRCISYLTIEHHGEIEESLADKVGNRIFGCDECVLACPYQHKAPLCRNRSFKYYPDRGILLLEAILDMGSEEFTAGFGDSPLLRPGLDGLKRNARICLRNSRPD
jgi:epoxyqueuosine reductase